MHRKEERGGADGWGIRRDREGMNRVGGELGEVDQRR